MGEREGWVKITDQKAAIQKIFDVADEFDRQKEQYNREETRRMMSTITSELCPDCDSEDRFEDNFCPCCGKRLIPEEEGESEPPTDFGGCVCHSVPGDSKLCKVHTARDYHFFTEGMKAGKEVMSDLPAEEPEKGFIETMYVAIHKGEIVASNNDIGVVHRESEKYHGEVHIAGIYYPSTPDATPRSPEDLKEVE